MRHIKITGKIDARWLRKSEELTEKLYEAGNHEARQDIIKKNESHWRKASIRNFLLKQFHNKCWYTEAKETVSSYHVDHFRPKGRVSDNPLLKEGYWWEAFNWKNYRISGQLINVKKKDRFPVESAFSIPTPEHPENSEYEPRLLLDPLDPEDVDLISFESNGEAVSAYENSEEDKNRVKNTIDILGLNRLPPLNEARQDIWRKCEENIIEYKKASSEPLALRAAKRSVYKENLKKMTGLNAEFSSVAIACIMKNAPEPLQRKILMNQAEQSG